MVEVAASTPDHRQSVTIASDHRSAAWGQRDKDELLRIHSDLAAIAAFVVLITATAAEAVVSGSKRSRIDTIIVHAISGPDQRCPGGKLTFSGAPGNAERWKRFFDTHPFLGIHYVVDRDGQVRASTPEVNMANHALDNNASSIGIELVHDGDGREPFGDLQINALIKLLREIRTRHAVPLENVKGHMDVDRRTFQCGGAVHKVKLDPGPNFPWPRVRAALGGETTPGPVARAVAKDAEPKLVIKPRPIDRRDWETLMGLMGRAQ